MSLHHNQAVKNMLLPRSEIQKLVRTTKVRLSAVSLNSSQRAHFKVILEGSLVPLFLCLMTELCHICVLFCSLHSHLKVCAGTCSCQKTVLRGRSPPALDWPEADTWAPATPPGPRQEQPPCTNAPRGLRGPGALTDRTVSLVCGPSPCSAAGRFGVTHGTLPYCARLHTCVRCSLCLNDKR